MNDIADTLPLRITEDPREIQALLLPEKGGQWTVGRHGVTRIIPYAENGEQAPVVWFAIYAENNLRVRVSGRAVEAVLYGEDG